MNRTVSVIIVTYNASATIEDCLMSLCNQAYQDIDLIIVDNNSSDSTLQIVNRVIQRLLFPVRVINSTTNLGFAGGNNLGFFYARNEYIALLNPDAFAHRDWLMHLVHSMDTHYEVGICASKLLVEGTSSIDSAGDIFSKALKSFKRGEGEPSERYDTEEYVFGACAGALLLRKKVLDDIGYFDEDLFLIGEDTDLCFRSQLAGWKTLYIPHAVVYHRVSSTIRRMSELQVYYSLRNSELVRVKNVPLAVFFRCLPEYVFLSFAEFLYFAVKHRRFSVYCRAKSDALRYFPKMLRKRRIIQSRRKVSSGYVLAIASPVLQSNFLKSKIAKFLHG